MPSESAISTINNNKSSTESVDIVTYSLTNLLHGVVHDVLGQQLLHHAINQVLEIVLQEYRDSKTSLRMILR